MTTLLTPLAYALTIGTASVAVLGSNPGRRGLLFFNPSNNTIAICPALTSAGAALAAVINGAGSINILSQGLLALPQAGWPAELSISSAFNAIASGASTPLTIWEF